MAEKHKPEKPKADISKFVTDLGLNYNQGTALRLIVEAAGMRRGKKKQETYKAAITHIRCEVDDLE